MAIDPKSPAAILAQQASLEDQLREIPEVVLLGELKARLEDPAVKDLIKAAGRIGQVLPASNVTNHIISLLNIHTAIAEHIEQRIAGVAAEEALRAEAAADKKPE